MDELLGDHSAHRKAHHCELVGCPSIPSGPLPPAHNRSVSPALALPRSPGEPRQIYRDHFELVFHCGLLGEPVARPPDKTVEQHEGGARAMRITCRVMSSCSRVG